MKRLAVIAALGTLVFAGCGYDSSGPDVEVTKTSENTWEVYDVDDYHPGRYIDRTCETEDKQVRSVARTDDDKIVVICEEKPAPTPTPGPYDPYEPTP